MDTKSLAKSKRAHSLHHSKKHSHHQASKVVSSINSSAENGSKIPVGKHVGMNSQQKSQGSRKLPLNWDRYGEEDFDLDSGKTTQESISQPSECVEPKSKGADYGHLILEAKAQAQARSNHSLDSDFDDDFMQDFGPLLSAKGKSILSWITDDNFEIENQTSTSIEAAFLSLNLDALAEQLAKAKPSDRLFMEPDVLPPELLDEELQACSQEFHQIKTYSAAIEPGLEASSFTEGLNPVEDKFLKSHVIVEDSSPSGNTPKFEASTAEEDLDMLLNSFTESSMPFENVKNGSLAGINDEIDILLEETCDLKLDTVVKPSLFEASSKSQLMDDFDSWLDTI